jgi:hypothetical protein
MGNMFHTPSTKRPKVVPMPDEKQIEQSKKREDRQRRTGRQSTILSDDLG